MRKLVFVPWLSIGDIKSGITIEEVRQNFSVDSEFFKTRLSSLPTLKLYDNTVYMFFDESGVCRGVELFPGAEIEFNGRILERNRTIDLELFFADFGYTSTTNSYGIEVPEVGLTTFHPYFGEEGETGIESFYVKLLRH